MSVETLRAAILNRAQELRIAVLVSVGVTHHKKGWRNCPCSWCSKKREATFVIGRCVPPSACAEEHPHHFYNYREVYIEDTRDARRDENRQKYRKLLQELEE